jgi:hypothetical protein
LAAKDVHGPWEVGRLKVDKRAGEVKLVEVVAAGVQHSPNRESVDSETESSDRGIGKGGYVLVDEWEAEESSD